MEAAISPATSVFPGVLGTIAAKMRTRQAPPSVNIGSTISVWEPLSQCQINGNVQCRDDQVAQSEIEQKPGRPAGNPAIGEKRGRGENAKPDDRIRCVQLPPARIARVQDLHRPVIECRADEPEHYPEHRRDAQPVGGFAQQVVGDIAAVAGRDLCVSRCCGG